MFILNKNGVLHPCVEQDNDPISCSGKLIKRQIARTGTCGKGGQFDA